MVWVHKLDCTNLSCLGGCPAWVSCTAFQNANSPVLFAKLACAAACCPPAATHAMLTPAAPPPRPVQCCGRSAPARCLCAARFATSGALLGPDLPDLTGPRLWQGSRLVSPLVLALPRLAARRCITPLQQQRGQPAQRLLHILSLSLSQTLRPRHRLTSPAAHLPLLFAASPRRRPRSWQTWCGPAWMWTPPSGPPWTTSLAPWR